jgi:hypothetical protein
MWLMVVVGGSVALVFALTLFLPYAQLMEAFSSSHGESMRLK